MATRTRKQVGPEVASVPVRARKAAKVRSPRAAAQPDGSTHGAPDPGGAASAASGSVSQLKRTLTPDNVVETITNLVTSLPVLLPAFVSPATSAALREKVFLGVTSINDCRYCKWAHTHWSMGQGVTLEEVTQILDRQVEPLTARSPADAAAVLFGRHYAEQLDQADPGATAVLRQVLQRGAGGRDPRLRALHHVHEPARQYRGRLSEPVLRHGGGRRRCAPRDPPPPRRQVRQRDRPRRAVSMATSAPGCGSAT